MLWIITPLHFAGKKSTKTFYIQVHRSLWVVSEERAGPGLLVGELHGPQYHRERPWLASLAGTILWECFETVVSSNWTPRPTRWSRFSTCSPSTSGTLTCSTTPTRPTGRTRSSMVPIESLDRFKTFSVEQQLTKRLQGTEMSFLWMLVRICTMINFKFYETHNFALRVWLFFASPGKVKVYNSTITLDFGFKSFNPWESYSLPQKILAVTIYQSEGGKRKKKKKEKNQHDLRF